jgi:hypothetical protein
MKSYELKYIPVAAGLLLASCCHVPEGHTGWQFSGKGKAVESFNPTGKVSSVLFENAYVADEGGAEKKLWAKGDLINVDVGENDVLLDLRCEIALGATARAELKVTLDRRTLLKLPILPENGSARIGPLYHRIRIPAQRLKDEKCRQLKIGISIDKSAAASPTRIDLSSLDIYWGPPIPEPSK